MRPWAVLMILAGAAAAADNLIENGSFEKGVKGWRVSGAVSAVVESGGPEGKKCLRITKRGVFRGGDQVSQKIERLPQSGKLTLSIHVKGKDLKNTWIKFYVYDKSGTSILEDVDLERLTGNFDWRELSRTYTLPPEAASAELRAAMFLGGELWLDGVEVTVPAAKKRTKLSATTRRWLDKNAVKIAGVEFGLPNRDLQPLKKILANKRIVLLGENTHGDGTCFAAKARLVRFLHESCGFEVLAFESGLYECDRANRLLAEGADTEEAMRAGIFGIWCVEEVRPLFDYMKTTFQGRNPRPLLLAGFDTRGSGKLAPKFWAELYEVLELTDEAKTTIRAADDRLQTGRYEPPAKERAATVAALATARHRFDESKQELSQEHGARRIEFLSWCLDNYIAREEFEFSKTLDREAWHSLNLRDSRMARNLAWLAKHRWPNKKIVCWAATVHILHNAKSIRESGKPRYSKHRFMGEQIHREFGDEAYVVGFAAHGGRAGMPWNRKFPLKPPADESIEATLFRYSEPFLFVNLRPPGPFSRTLPLAVLGYSRVYTASWPKVIDGLFYVEEMHPASFLENSD